MKWKKLFSKPIVRDLLCICVLALFLLLLSIMISENGNYILGAKTDFSMQHYIFPEYFRNLFYDTHDLFPDFAFHLGAGQNIYYMSYYGLLSPIIFVSYLFPNVSMLDFIITSMFIVVILSCVLWYFYLRKSNYSRSVCFIVTFLFLCSAPLIFHSHRHIMFVSYFPFLIMGFYGIDRFLEHKKSTLLILSIALMIFTSYYYSVSGIFVLFIFGIFKYIRLYDFKVKEFFSFILSLFFRIMIAVLISGILILPTLYTLLVGRSGDASGISILDLFKPNMYMLYHTYSIGLTLVSLIATIYMIFSKRKENRLLSILLLVMSIFPIFNFVLNGFLYINAKSLIPVILLVLINMSDCFEEWFSKMKGKYKVVLIIYLIISASVICFTCNSRENLMPKKLVNNEFHSNYGNYVEELQENDENLYRINSSLIDSTYINKVSNMSEYKSSLYSSTSNKYYKDIYQKLFNNPLLCRNKFMLISSNNLLFEMYMGEKYIFSREDYHNIYKKITNIGDIYVYQNDYVLPIGYATDKIISNDDFKKLNYPDNIINMLGSVITDDETNKNLSYSDDIQLDYEIVKEENVRYQKSESGYLIDASNDAEISLKLHNDLEGKLLFISFDLLDNNSCGHGNKDLTIQINGVTNKLTCKEWKYNNQNTNFAYVLSELHDNTLNIKLVKGKYKIGNIKVSTLDFDDIKDINQNIDPFIIDKDKTKGDDIVGSIDVSRDAYFSLSIPYDDGFTIFVDGKEVEYEKINNSFIGFKIETGKHDIKITYDAPFKNIGLICSGVGALLLLIMIFYERRKKIC